MKKLFSKTNFPESPGKNIHHWQEADTTFEVLSDGKYVISISSSAKNATLNNSKDDDDLRVVIDGYEFGKREIHQDKVSWKGFGTAASWDGASLRGEEKTIYFFMRLSAGKHTVQFYADETPTIHKMHVLQIEETEDGAIEDVIFDFHEHAPGQKVDVNGIPWKAFVIAPGFNIIKLVDIIASAQSGKQKNGTDGDNIKVYANGRIVHNPKAPTSDKYKNFFFSGDLSQGRKEALMIPGKDFLLNDQDVSIELWYDEKPMLKQVKFELEVQSYYAQPNTLKKRIATAIEGSRLPKKLLWDNWGLIFGSVNTSTDAALQYAEVHGFTWTDGNGIVRRSVEDNEPDALRHFMWNVILSREIGAEATEIITTNHELYWMELNNKKELSRTNVMDIWNNKQGREFATEHPKKDYLYLFDLAKSERKLILSLEDVTEEHRKATEDIINRTK